MAPSKAKVPEPPMRTFDEAFAELNLTHAERTAMVWHLAMYRARKTVEALLTPDYGDINEQTLAELKAQAKMILR